MATSENILISTEGIKNSLKKYKPLNAITEYVWNGFDAKASIVDICINTNTLAGIEKITVSDNGYGIDRRNLDQKFKPFYQSEKIYDPDTKYSATHGKNGVGRLTFFAFANFAEWRTVYSCDDKRLSYSIKVSSTELEKYSTSEERETGEATGTTIIFEDFISSDLTADTIRLHLAKEFCWFLELHRDNGYSIRINSESLTYSDLIMSREECSFAYENTSTIFDTSFICWAQFLNEYSKYYFIDSHGKEVCKENTTLNNKGDGFYHSVFIRSPFFDNFDVSQNIMPQITCAEMKNRKSDEFQFLMKEINKKLFDIRKPFIKEHVYKVIEDMDIDAAFPNKENLVEQYKKSQIEDLIKSIYIAQPKIFTSQMNKEQKKTFIRMLDVIMQSGEVEALFKVLEEALEMDSNELNELADILKYAKMSNITKTIKLIKDRYLAESDLKSLVFNKDLKAAEVPHLQKMIEQHYWIFGEQYNLVTAAEPTFEEALKRYLKYLHKEYEDASIDHPDKLKQMDIFAVRQDKSISGFNNIVIELKHPDILLGETQLSQVKKYMSVIISVEQFNAANMTWEFYLVGNRFDSSGYIQREIENNRGHGEKSLVYNVAPYKIYVKTWSEIFAEFEMRHEHLNKVLMLEQAVLQREFESASHLIQLQTGSSAIMPAEMTTAASK